MRLSIYAAAFNSATLLGQSIAAPTVDPKSPGQTLDRRDDASEEALKYFHEPGCVVVDGLLACFVFSNKSFVQER